MTDLQAPPPTAAPSASTDASPSPIVPRRRPRRLVRRVLKHVVMVAASIAMIYPLLWMVVSSLRPNEEIFRNPGLLPISFNVENYVQGWNALAQPFSHYIINSTIL